MKEYQFTFEVPDDFDPEELAIDFEYKDEMKLVREGDPVTPHLIASIFNTVKPEKVDKDSVIIFRFPADLPPEEAQYIKNELEAQFGVPAMGLTDDIQLLVQSKEQALEMLEGMKQKIEIRANILSK